MSNKSRGLVGLVVVTSAAAALATTGMANAAGAPHVAHSKSSTPTITVTASTGSFKVKAPKSIAAGTVDLDAQSKTAAASFGITRFKSGYTIANFKSDFATSETKHNKAGLKALNHAVENTTFYGGLDAQKGQTLTGSIVLPKAGTYYLAKEGNTRLEHVTKLTVVGHGTGKITSSATVKAESGDKFGGDATLPAKGTITFKNVSKGATASPHFLVLQHVTDGTTKKDIENYFASGSNDPPPFALEGGANSDVISPGISMGMTYDLPKGTYAELCFFPDLKTGMPHAYMGMIRIVTLS